MGYTHYWSLTVGSIPDGAYLHARDDIANIISIWEHDTGLKIRGWDGTGKPELSDVAISYNGDATRNSDCETFLLAAAPTVPEWQTDATFVDEAGNRVPFVAPGVARFFTKTRDLPYDAVVCASLLAVREHYRDAVTVESDGGWFDWEAGADLYARATGRPAVCPPAIWDGN